VSSTAYSDLKAAWHLAEIDQLRRGEQIAPRQVQLILSDLCNQDCHFCSYRMSNGLSSEQFGEVKDGKLNMNPNRRIPTDKAEEIVRDCARLGVGAIQFTGGGEPTVHPDHLRIMRLALDCGLDCGLVTNGVLLRPGWEDVYRQFKWIRVSVDASNAQEYAKVRRVPEAIYSKVLGNVRSIAETVGPECLLGVGYVVTRENWEHLFSGIEQIRDTGAHYVRLSAMFSTEGEDYYGHDLPAIRRNIADLSVLETPRFKIVNLFGDRISDLKQHAPDYSFCGYQQFNCYVGGNLKVYRCCTTAYTAHGEVGDLSKQSFRDWFYSADKLAAYGQFDARSCNVCQFNNKNKAINYMLDKQPLHVNFV
jgi:MoaA/NifB/PqqE/SkfB family radical SAM enzyme